MKLLRKKQSLLSVFLFLGLVMLTNPLNSSAASPPTESQLTPIPVEIKGAPNIPHPVYNGEGVFFKAIARGGANGDLRYYWDFGDNNWQESPGPEKMYWFDRCGEFPILAGVKDIEGNVGNASTTVKVIGGDRKPVPIIDVPSLPNNETHFLDLPIVLNASNSFDIDPGDGIAIYEWDLDGDDDFEDKVGKEVAIPPNELETQFGWLENTIQTIKLRVEDNNANTAIQETSIKIGESIPNARINALNHSARPNEDVTFDASKSKHNNPSRQILKYEWDFDNDYIWDDVIYFPNPPISIHSWPMAGLYPVNLNVSDDVGNWNVAQYIMNVTLENRFPYPILSSPVNDTILAFGQPLILDGSESYDPDSDAGDSVAAYEWDLNLDGAPDRFGPIVNLPPNEIDGLGWLPGSSHEFKLIVRDTLGLNNTARYRINISGNHPIPKIAPLPEHAIPYDWINFNASKSSHPNPTRTITKYEWDFDADGVYDNSGSLPDIKVRVDRRFGPTITLRIEDDAGGVAIQTVPLPFQSVNRPPCIYEAWPKEELTYPRGDNLDLRVDFIDYDLPFGDSIATVQWDLDLDGQFDDFSGNGTITWEKIQSMMDVDSDDSFEIQVKVVDDEGAYAIETAIFNLEEKTEPEPAPQDEDLISGVSLLGLGFCICATITMKSILISKKKR